MELVDSRRLTGPNVIQPVAGAVLDVRLGDEEGAGPLVALWREELARLLAAVGWSDQRMAVREFPGGLSLGLTAPVDALYAATEVNEAAFAAAAGRLDGHEASPDVDGLIAMIREERNPRLAALRAEALRRDVEFLSDDDHVSVGLGAGSRTWPVDSIPDLVDVDWSQVFDIPVVLVTGTNGKSTTVRLLSAIAAEAGRVAGVSSTDWLRVGAETLDSGDWSGPGGARRVLRDPRVEVAILETARGGMLRRGLAVSAADVAVVTNIAADHLGEWGVADLEMLADTKMLVSGVAKCLVLSASDELSRRRARSLVRPPGAELVWVGFQDEVPAGKSVLVSGGDLVVREGAERTLMLIADIPITLDGAARHNVRNVLSATAAALALEIPDAAIVAGLRGFQSTASSNPGRLNQFAFGDVTVLVDFAHNPHGTEALLEMATRVPARRRLALLGQAGDRGDEAIRELARVAWKSRPDRIIVKEMPEELRGRRAGEVPELLTSELARCGAPPEVVEVASSELDAVRRALEWAEPGDLLLLICHSQRSATLGWLERLRESGWLPGAPLSAWDPSLEPDPGTQDSQG